MILLIPIQGFSFQLIIFKTSRLMYPAEASVQLEPVNLLHAAVIQEMADHPDIAATTRIEYPYPPGQAERFIKVRMQERAQGESLVCAVKSATQVVGVCGLIEITPDRAAEVGYWIGRTYWGHGFATQAVAAILGYAFQELDLKSVYAKCLANNAASIRVLTKNGFQYQQSAPHSVVHWPNSVPLHIYAITVSEWSKTHKL